MADKSRSLEDSLGSLVAICARFAPLVLLVCLVLSGIAFRFVTTHFAVNTNSANLISEDLDWRERNRELQNAFPQSQKTILVVVDGATPELASRAADTLAQAASAEPALFEHVERPGAGPFFARNGLLYLSMDKVRQFMSDLIAAQPLLGQLAADPSLKGTMDALDLALDGVERDQTDAAQLQKPLSVFADTLSKVANGENAFLAWRQLIGETDAGGNATRQLILIKPVLDFSRLAPGKPATDELRRLAQENDLTQKNGVNVRLSGDIPLADEEFQSVAQNMDIIVPIMLVSVLVLLFLALRSAKLIGAVLITLIVGLIFTAAFGLAAIGPFNMISVAFAVLFVGLGVDFGIQFGVRFGTERLHAAVEPALRATGAGVGGALGLAAICTAAGFLAFLPTDYRGVSELGLIAGTGMLIAFSLSLTLLPALIKLTAPRPRRTTGSLPLEGLDAWLASHAKTVLLGACLIGIVASASLPLLRFDFNPLNLKNPESESVSTLFDLMKDKRTTPNTIGILEPSLAKADQVAAEVRKLPEVDRAITLSSFVPKDQDEKIAIIDDAAFLLEPTLDPFMVAATPDPEEIRASFLNTAARLREFAQQGGAAARSALKLSSALTKLANGGPEDLARAHRALIPGLDVLLDQVRLSLRPSEVSQQTLPESLKQSWVAPDGQARVEVVPEGDPNDNATLNRFADAVAKVAPNATGTAITIQKSANVVVNAFRNAGILALVAITLVLALVLRNVTDVALTLAPLLLSGLLTLGTCALIGLNLNFANIIALPLLLGLGVAFNIYYVTAWRRLPSGPMLATPLSRAILFSALTTATAFGSLWASSHAGTASMGALLTLSLAWTLISTFLVLPPLLAWTRTKREKTSRSQGE